MSEEIPHADEVFEWVAVYDDETNLFQYNEDGSENAYGDIDRTKLTEFHIRVKEAPSSVFALALEPGQRLIYRKRVSIDSASSEKNWVIYLVGWQQTIGDRNVQSLNWVFPDGSVIQTGRFREDHPIFYGVATMDIEEAPVGE